MRTLWAIAILVLGWGFSAQSQGAVIGSSAVNSSQPKFELNEKKLKENIINRIKISKDNKNAVLNKLEESMVSIDNKFPFTIGELKLFAVKISFGPPDNKNRGVLNLIVDHTGQLQVTDIQELSTGKSLTLHAISEIERISLPKDLGTEVFKGTGKHEVVLISDPFCPFCRKTWDYLTQHKDKIKSLKLSHYSVKPASDIACTVMVFAEQNKMKIFDIVNFAYTRLTSKETPEEIIQEFFTEFPELKKQLGDDPKAAYQLLKDKYAPMLQNEFKIPDSIGVSETPTTFIDGVRVVGFDNQKIDGLMP